MQEKDFLTVARVRIRNGCGDHSCLVLKPKGMGTNGGCRCIPPGVGFAKRQEIVLELQRRGYPM